MTDPTPIGIDIGSDSFDAAYLRLNGKWKQSQFSNHPDGFAALEAYIPEQAWVIMEASGPYFLPLATWLQERSIPVSVVNPLQLRRFAQMKLLRAKTDPVDARMAAVYGDEQRPELWKAPSKISLRMRQILSRLQLLHKQKTAQINQAKSFEATGVSDPAVADQQQTMLQMFTRQIEKLNEELQRLAKQAYDDLHERLATIKGIGPKAAAVLIVLTDGFHRFPTPEGLASYIGLTSHPWSSGKSVQGRGKISKIGADVARSVLYMCAQSARKSNNACYALNKRLEEKGKPNKVILIAIAHKLVRQAWAIGTKGGIYNPNYA